MKRFILILVILLILPVILHSEPYKPKPVVFIHGYTSNSGTWGAYTDDPLNNRTEVICWDSVKKHKGETYYKMLKYANTYASVWHKYEEDSLGIPPTYTIPGDDAYPNKTFLEVINFEYECGSVDEGGKGWPTAYKRGHDGPNPYAWQEDWGSELWRRTKEVLEEYYGDGNPNTFEEWNTLLEAEVILVAHSQGGLAIREMLYLDGERTSEPHLSDNIKVVVTTGTPHRGTPFMDYWGVGEFWTGMLFYWLPLDAIIFQHLWNPASWEVGWQGWWPILRGTLMDFLPGVGVGFIGGEFLFNKYTDSGRDLGSLTDINPFMEHICSENALQYSREIPFRTIVSTIDLPVGVEGTVWFLASVQATAYSLQFRFVEAGWKLGSAYMFTDWGNNSDFAVHKSSQKAVELGIRKEMLGIYNRRHDKETNNYKSIVAGIESPPTLDSMLLTVRTEDSTYTNPLSPNTIDTVVGILDSVSIEFKLNDVYFLSQTNIKININGVSSGGINYPEDTSLIARV